LGIFATVAMIIMSYRNHTIKYFLSILILFFGISDSFAQINDEIIKSKGKPYKNFESVHEVSIIPPVKSDNAVIHNVILMIGDGMGATQVYAGYVANKGHLYITQCPVTGLAKTYSADNLITDSAAGATAMATGEKTKDGFVGIDAHKKPVETILEYAEKNGLSTGMVVTSSITHATPACFIAHSLSRDFNEEIASYFLKTDIDFFIGGGRNFFYPRSDGLNLMQQLRDKKYQILTTPEGIDSINSARVAGLIWEEHGPSVLKGRGDMLEKSTQKAVEELSRNEKGFFLMVEGSQIDWGGHQNDTRYLVEEMLDFDKAVGKALEFASNDGHTLVIITADHETGGFAVTGGNIKRGSVIGEFLTDSHTGVWVPVYAYGPGAENFTGIYENTDIFKKMKELMDKGLNISNSVGNR
jgi:alkaline phosphatase